MYDIRQYLKDRGIKYWLQGKNVSRGWIGTKCIFPGCHDHSNHLGFNPMRGVFSCWLCGKTGSFRYYISVREKVSQDRAKEIANQYRRVAPALAQTTPDKPTEIQKILPQEATKEFSQPYLDYLRKRNFDAEFLISKYDLYASYFGRLKFRIIIPIFRDGVIMNYIARDITDLKDLKYIACENELANEDIHNLLYNIDNCTGDKLVVVEGATDVWRFGDDFCAILGKKITRRQINLLRRHKAQEIYMLLDPDALAEAKKYAYLLSPFKKLRFLETDSGEDPGESTKQDVLELRQMIFY